MKHFFDLTFRPFFIISGVATALAGMNALWPRWAVEHIEKLVFVREYTIILQHWGITVGLMGIFMIAAAFREEWRTPILLYSACEKVFIVYLVIANASHTYADGFRLAAIVDATVVFYTIVYFTAQALKTHAWKVSSPAPIA